MQKENYTIQEIILGLRSEYQKQQVELEKLKKLCGFDKKIVEDFDFYVSNGERKEELQPELCCKYIEKQNQLQKLLKKIDNIISGEKINISPKYDAISVCDNNNRNYFSLANKETLEKYPIYVPEYNDEEFSILKNKLLSSEFAIPFSNRSPSDLDYLSIKTASIIISLWQESCVFYQPKTDSIRFIRNRELTDEEIVSLLEKTIPSSSLHPYHITTIDTSGIIGKSIILEKTVPSKNVELSIREEEKQFVLSKVRK